MQIRKPREANWEHVKILVLMWIKKAKEKKMMAKVDCEHKFETTISKWRKILTPVTKGSCLEHVKNGLTCKDKWSSITSNFKKIFDKHWTKSKLLRHEYLWERNNVQIFYNFEQNLYEMITRFLNNWPIFRPPHMKNLMADGVKFCKPIGYTPKQAIELDDNLIAPKLKMWYEDLNATTDNIYAHNTDEAWLYEQPQITKPFLTKCVNVSRATTPM